MPLGIYSFAVVIVAVNVILGVATFVLNGMRQWSLESM